MTGFQRTCSPRRSRRGFRWSDSFDSLQGSMDGWDWGSPNLQTIVRFSWNWQYQKGNQVFHAMDILSPIFQTCFIIFPHIPTIHCISLPYNIAGETHNVYRYLISEETKFRSAACKTRSVASILNGPDREGWRPSPSTLRLKTGAP